MNRKHSVLGPLLGLAVPFAFAEGFLLIVRLVLAGDPAALAMYPKVCAGVYLFWAPFAIRNIRTCLRDRNIEKAKTAAREKSGRRSAELTEK